MRKQWLCCRWMVPIQTSRFWIKLKSIGTRTSYPRSWTLDDVAFTLSMVLWRLGLKATGWQTKKILNAIWKLFNDSFVRKDLYIKLNQTDEFPLMFCRTRCVEDTPVVSRAMAVWKNVIKFVQSYQSQSKLDQSNDNRLYNHLLKYHADLLIPVKFQFFKDVDNVLSPHLQTDAPMVPFVCGALEEIICRLMRMI